MKHFIKYLALSTTLLMLLVGCDKKDTVTFASVGNSATLSASVSKIAATATDSLKPALVLKWTNPQYATDSSTVLYTIQFDSSGRNFTKAVSFTVTDALTDTFTAKQLNNVLTGFGFQFKVAYNVDVRVISSYANHNVALTSNTVTVNMTPYVTPPVVATPTQVVLDPSDAGNVVGTGLFLVGDGSQGGWSNPVPVPTQQFYQKDSVTYVGVFNLVGGNSYLLLPFNGSWNYKYAVSDVSVPGIAAGTGGKFGFYSNSVKSNYTNNIPAPATSGWYTITVDFQHGIYTVVPYTSTFPTNLYIVGDATADGWNNSNPPVNPAFTQLDAARFQLTIPLIGGKNFLMLPVAGSWANKYAVADGTVPSSGGSFGYNLSTNFNGPAASGTYTITANFYDLTFMVK